MADYLEQNPSEAKALIWRVNQELRRVYAIEPKGSFGADVYEASKCKKARSAGSIATVGM